MKRFLLLLTGLLLAVNTAFASGNMKLYDASSEEYRKLHILSQISGTAGPASTFPLTGTQLILALNQIDPSSLPSYYREMYKELRAELEREVKGAEVNFPVTLSPQFFVGDIYDSRSTFFIPFRDEEPGINVGYNVLATKNIYIESALPFKNSPTEGLTPQTSFDWLINARGGELEIFGSEGKIMFFSLFPLVARGALGNEYFNVVIGRTRHAMGDAYTSNLTVGDNFDYQELLEFNLTTRYFTYNIALTHFDLQDENGKVINPYFSGPQQSRVAHRLDINLFDKVKLNLTLVTLYCSSVSFDFRWFIPFMVSHNYYNYSSGTVIGDQDEANNMMSLEFEVPFGLRMKLGGQVVMDQFELPSESCDPNHDSTPNAFGFLLNYSYIHLFEHSSLELFLEGVYTMPYLYLSTKYEDDTKTTRNWNYDYYLGYYRLVGEKNHEAELAYSGYINGPDTIAVTFGAIYNNFESEISSKFMLSYIVQGESAWDNCDFDNLRSNLTPTGIPTHTVSLEDLTEAQVSRRVSLKFGFALDFAFNYDHEWGAFRFSPQGYFGANIVIL